MINSLSLLLPTLELIQGFILRYFYGSKYYTWDFSLTFIYNAECSPLT